MERVDRFTADQHDGASWCWVVVDEVVARGGITTIGAVLMPSTAGCQGEALARDEVHAMQRTRSVAARGPLIGYSTGQDPEPVYFQPPVPTRSQALAQVNGSMRRHPIVHRLSDFGPERWPSLDFITQPAARRQLTAPANSPGHDGEPNAPTDVEDSRRERPRRTGRSAQESPYGPPAHRER